MHFTLFSFLLLPSLARAVPVFSSPPQLLPTGYDVKQDVINIHNAVLALDKTVQGFNGGHFLTALVEGAPVLAGVADIHRVNRAGFGHALAALPFSVQESNDVVNTVVATGSRPAIELYGVANAIMPI
ncbi:hypothetical protein J1614_006766 [Plenodomus biglobosus]|nr:hypothetical protein J1614_006766 [Plenodomus biglobosus]